MKKKINIIMFLFISIQVVAQQWTATYYGDKYKTLRRTASGERFNKESMTCAAPKSYAFGTLLRITNLANNKSVIVKITDRGEFGNRNIDLTYGAFGKIANHKLGRIKIKVEIYDRNSKVI